MENGADLLKLLLATGSMIPIVAWVLWYVLTRLIPTLMTDFKQTNSELVKELRESRADFQEILEKQRNHCAQVHHEKIYKGLGS